MEAARPDVDAYVLAWIRRQPLKGAWFFEERNGNCRLAAELATQLSATSSTWAHFVAPLAEWTAQEFAKGTRTPGLKAPTRPTRGKRRAVTGKTIAPKLEKAAAPQKVCSVCGGGIRSGTELCRACGIESSAQRLLTVGASKGRLASHTLTAEGKRSKTQQVNRAAIKAWSASDQPFWLTYTFYIEKLQPLLVTLSSSAVARHLGVSRGYANEVRRGKVPHQRHWWPLAKLAGLSR